MDAWGEKKYENELSASEQVNTRNNELKPNYFLRRKPFRNIKIFSRRKRRRKKNEVNEVKFDLAGGYGLCSLRLFFNKLSEECFYTSLINFLSGFSRVRYRATYTSVASSMAGKQVESVRKLEKGKN